MVLGSIIRIVTYNLVVLYTIIRIIFNNIIKDIKVTAYSSILLARV